MFNQPFKKLIVLASCILLASCKSKSQVGRATTYVVVDTLNTSMLDYKKLFPESDKYGIELIKKDIAIIYMYENDSLIKFSDKQLAKIDYTPTISRAVYINDTLRISTSLGFFAGAAVGIEITKDTFKGYYYENADHTPVYKYRLSDSCYISDITVSPVSEKLILNKRPTFKNGEELAGEYYGTFQPFYEKELSEIKLRKVRWKIVFKCTIISIPGTIKN